MTSIAMPTYADTRNEASRFRIPWVYAILLGCAFFVFQHDVKVSTYKFFIPEKDAIGSESGLVKSGRSVGLVAIAGMGIVGLLSSSRFEFHIRRELFWPAALLFGWTLLSVLWSASTSVSMKQIFMGTMCLIGAAGLARRCSLTEIVTFSMVVTAAYIILGLGVEFALGTFKPTDPIHRFAGTVHPNLQSFHCAILCLGAFSLVRAKGNGSFFLVAVLLFAFAAMLLTRSRGGLVAMLLGMGLNWFVTSSHMAKFISLLSGCFFASIIAMMLSLQGVDVVGRFDAAKSMGRADGEDTQSLSGRMPLWIEVLNQVSHRPITGFGYGAFWSLPQVESVHAKAGWDAPDAHSLYIESLLNWGLPGLVLVVWIGWSSLRTSTVVYERTRDAGAAFFASYFLFGMVNGISESVFTGASIGTFLAAAGYFHLTFWAPDVAGVESI